MTIEELSVVLAHPLVIAVVTTVITGFSAGIITRTWQRKRKEFEIRILLINELTEAIVEITSVLSSRYIEKVDDGRLESMIIKSNKIGANLFAYFPNEQLPNEWEEYKTNCFFLWDIATKLKKSELDLNENKNIITSVQNYVVRILPTSNIDWEKIFQEKDQKELYRVGGKLLNYYKYFVQKVHSLKIEIA